MNPSNDAAQRQRLLLAAGALDPLLARHVQEQAIELAVIGLHEQPGVLRVLSRAPPAGRCRC